MRAGGRAGGDAACFDTQQIAQAYPELVYDRDRTLLETPARCTGRLQVGADQGAVFQITGGNEAVPLEMVPLYNTTGGVTATVFSFVAINAHTKQPDDAFLVLDDLLSRQGQKTSLLFRRLGESGGILPYDGLGSPGDPVQDAEGSSWDWSAEDDEEFREVVDCITQVHLYGTLEMELNTLARGFYSLRQGNPYWPYRDLKEWTHEVYSRMEQELGE